MLVLSRKTGERVLIDDRIVLTVVRIGPNAVRLGIEAPKDMNIVREEIKGGHPIQADQSDVADLGQRVFDPLGVAECYADASHVGLIDE